MTPGRAVWAAPSRPPLVLDECPVSFITPESVQLVHDFWRAKQLRQPPLSGGLYQWPARLLDAWLVLDQEFERWRESRRRPSRPNGADYVSK